MLTPLDEHQLLVFWTQLLVLVAFARLFGEVMRRVNLPSVIGQLAAGVFLGPPIFGKVWPDGFHWFLPEYEIQSGALYAVSWLGVALLLVTAGFETDLGLIRRLGRAAALVTGFSLLFPLAGGLVMGSLLPESFIGAESDRTVFALFVAAALAVSALAVIAKILSELGLMRRDFGQITVAAGMANDVVGWIMLAVFTGFAISGEVSAVGIVRTVGGLAIFLALAMTLGQRAVDRSLRFVRRDGANVPGAMTVVIFTMLIFGVATQALGIEAVLGAFVAGVVLHRSRFQQREVLSHLESITDTFLAPVFFATAGLRVDLSLLGQDDALTWAGAVVAVAIVAKFVGAFIGSPSMNLYEATVNVGENGGTVQLGSQTLSIGPETLAARPALAGYNGKPVILGIRPEDFEDAAMVEHDTSGKQLNSTVNLIEALGSEIMVHFDIDARRIDSGDPDAVEDADSSSNAVGRFHPRSQARMRDSVTVAVTTENMHFFDADTRRAIWD